MAKSLLLHLHYYFPTTTTTRIIYSAGGDKKNPSDHPSRRTHWVSRDPGKLKSKQKNMDLGLAAGGGGEVGRRGMPLSEVVSDCVNRWFEDTLRDANAGDIGMQVLVGQMYCVGYGVPKDVAKGRAWIDTASKSRSSAQKVGDKHPGYNASASDSPEAAH